MANLLILNEIPNLLELVKSCRSDLSAISGLSEAATCDEKSDVVSTSGRIADRPFGELNSAELSLCADLSICPESVWADEPQIEKSVCADN